MALSPNTFYSLNPMRLRSPSSLSPLQTFHAQAGVNSLSVHWRTAKGMATRLNVHTLILRDILRSVLAEVAEVVVKLHCEVASHNAVPDRKSVV